MKLSKEWAEEIYDAFEAIWLNDDIPEEKYSLLNNIDTLTQGIKDVRKELIEELIKALEEKIDNTFCEEGYESAFGRGHEKGLLSAKEIIEARLPK
jgi:hypothetical protein